MKRITLFLIVLLCAAEPLMAQKMKLVKDVNPGYYNPSNPAIVGGLSNGKVLFFAGNNTDITYGSELWVSDGTAQGTTLVKDIAPGKNNSVFAYTSHVINDRLYFIANDGNGRRLWTSDGTDTGTYMLMDSARMYTKVFSDNPVVYYNGKIYFGAEDTAHGVELWCTDGTRAGTQLFMDIIPGKQGSAPCYMTVAFGKLIFAAYSPATGQELWSSDGTTAGTKMIADLYPGTDNGVGNIAIPARLFNNALYFPGKSSKAIGNEVYATNGDSIWLVKNIHTRSEAASDPSYFTIAGNKLFFSAYDIAHGRELWVSDGTTAGTKLVKDIEPGHNGTVSLLHGEINGNLLFEAITTAGGRELWVSDGTAAGTVMIADIYTGTGNGKIPTRAELNTLSGFNGCNFMHDGKFYFAGASDTGGGVQLFVTNGTAAGTKGIECDQPAPNLPGIHFTEVNWLNVLHNKVWVSYKPGAYDYELYSYDIYDTPTHVGNVFGSENSVSVYPNPTAGSFLVRLDAKASSNAMLTIADMRGSVVYSQSIERGTRHIAVTLPQVTPGIYNVILQLDGDVVSRKITVK